MVGPAGTEPPSQFSLLGHYGIQARPPRQGSSYRPSLSHLVDTGHRINVNTAFSVIYRIPKTLSRTVRLRLLHIAEAVAIRSTKPELCIQNEHVQTLFLPWPTLD
uniref:Uncharacterized protein n=1 Tax=Trichobilharzia regenti TaxID=157069 RepID=A0AA85J5E9_TRIRE|nr:unnamed protein product [Trichobilharzia regenti]